MAILIQTYTARSGDRELAVRCATAQDAAKDLIRKATPQSILGAVIRVDSEEGKRICVRTAKVAADVGYSLELYKYGYRLIPMNEVVGEG